MDISFPQQKQIYNSNFIINETSFSLETDTSTKLFFPNLLPLAGTTPFFEVFSCVGDYTTLSDQGASLKMKNFLAKMLGRFHVG